MIQIDMPPDRGGFDIESKEQAIQLLIDLSAASEHAFLMEVMILGVCGAAGIDAMQVAAAQELGRRRGRRRASATLGAERVETMVQTMKETISS